MCALFETVSVVVADAALNDFAKSELVIGRESVSIATKITQVAKTT
ncbi:MAG: hypothetical protein QXS85_02060 [Acidilobaceae archaeon]